MKIISLLVIGLTVFTTNISAKTINVESITIDKFQEDKLVLNNGKKWEVVPEMMIFLKNMDKAVLEFSEQQNRSSKEYQNLALLIDKNIRDLTVNCTMKGKAHDELHKWLVPFIQLSTDFDEAKNIEEQKVVVEEIKKSFKVFNTYFR